MVIFIALTMDLNHIVTVNSILRTEWTSMTQDCRWPHLGFVKAASNFSGFFPGLLSAVLLLILIEVSAPLFPRFDIYTAGEVLLLSRWDACFIWSTYGFM
jgi:hypothetical protein